MGKIVVLTVIDTKDAEALVLPENALTEWGMFMYEESLGCVELQEKIGKELGLRMHRQYLKKGGAVLPAHDPCGKNVTNE
jgi:hypothetical protein